MALQSLDPNQADRYEAFHRFRRRAQRGEFATLLDKPTRRLIEQAAALPDHALEIGALRLALARAIAEETDPTRMGLTVARLAHAIARVAALAPQADHDRTTTAALRLLDTALPSPSDAGHPSPLSSLTGVGGEGASIARALPPSPNHGRGACAGGEGRNAEPPPTIDEDAR